jgi:hypothetical protein
MKILISCLVLDAHNCYPYDGKWTDRIDRALKTGFPVGIEQDIASAVDPVTVTRRPVVTHTPKTTGSEPTLRDHFFELVGADAEYSWQVQPGCGVGSCSAGSPRIVQMAIRFRF